MSPKNFREFFCTALDECALTDDSLCEWTGIGRERLAAIKAGTAWPSPVEVVACLYAVDQCWTGAPEEHQRAVLEAHHGEPRLPRDGVVQAINTVFEDARRKPVTPYTTASELPEFLTVNEVCSYLTLSRNMVYGAIQSGQLPSRQIAGKKYRIHRSDLLALSNALSELAEKAV